MNATASTRSKNILLVDDDPAARESIKLLLSIDRHNVTEAANGPEALQLFSGSTYDLVITDYLMPGMLGDELAQNIWNIAPRQPVIMITAYLEKLANAGKLADAMLGKPVSIEDLRSLIPRPTERINSTRKTTFSRSDLQNRAAVVGDVLDEIIQRKAPVRTLDIWRKK
jgi:CheY-like chemotaxis protein